MLERDDSHRLAGVLRGRRVGVFALGFSQLSTAFLCTLMVITLTSQDVQAGIWDPEEEISTDLPPGWQRYPSIGVDGDKVHIVWEDGTDGDIDIYYRHFNGTEWQPEMEISRDIGSEIQVSPIIAVDGDKIYAVWESWRDGDSDIIFRFFNGTDWQPEQEISSDITSESQWNPSITAEGGRAYAVWEDRGGGDLDIHYRHFNGTAWEPEVEISSDAANEDQRKPSVAVEGGKVYVVWEDREDGDFDIYYRHFNGTAWEPEGEISMDVGNEYQWSPSVAVEGGEVHVAWEHEEGLNYDINYRLNNGTDWELVLEISSDTESEVQRYPSITADGGRVHVAWMDTKGGDVDIYYRSFVGGNWQSEIEVSTDIGKEYQWNPSIASNGTRVHIAWHDWGDGDGDVYYRHFNGMNWQPKQRISTDVIQEEQRNPSISVTGRDVYVVWEDPEDGDSDIYCRYFDGNEWQSEEEISTDGGVEPQISPSVVADGVMVHIVWQDLGDGDADIYYRRFNGTAWEPEREISTDVGTEDQLNPSVSAWNGRVYVIWEDLGDGDPDIYYRYYNGTAWKPEQEVSSDLGNEPQLNPSIVAEDGQVHTVWEDRGDGDTDIYYRLFNGTAWEPEQEISSDVGTETQEKPSIAATNGMVHVVWEDQGGGDIDISYRLFNGTGWELEQEISIDSGAELQSNPSVSVENVKAYVIWSDTGDGDKDIYFRHHNGTSWEMPIEISTDENAEEQSSPSIGVYNGISHVVWLDWEDGDADVYYKRGRIEDFTPPESQASIIAPHWRTTPIFNIDWTATDDDSLVNISLSYRYSPDNSSWSVWNEWAYDDSITGTSASGSFGFGAPQGDGFYEFTTIASDGHWNIEQGPDLAEANVVVDTVSPVGSVTINDGDVWSTSTFITLALTYSDSTSGVSQVRYGDDGIWDTEPWENPIKSKSWTLTPEDGMKPVYYQIIDNAGLQSGTYSDSIQLDMTSPTIATATPTNGATDVEVTTDIRVTFNERMAEPATEIHFSLKTHDTYVDGTLNWSTDGRTLIFTPADNLIHRTTYTIQVITGEDVAGNILRIPFEASFTTREVEGEPGILDQYWWTAVLIVIVMILMIFLVMRRRKPSIGEDAPAEDIPVEPSKETVETNCSVSPLRSVGPCPIR